MLKSGEYEFFVNGSCFTKQIQRCYNNVKEKALTYV